MVSMGGHGHLRADRAGAGGGSQRQCAAVCSELLCDNAHQPRNARDSGERHRDVAGDGGLEWADGEWAGGL